MHPAQIIDKVEIVLRLILIRKGSRPQLKARKSELVDVLGDVVRRTVNSQNVCGQWSHRPAVETPRRRNVRQAVPNPVVAEPEIIH